MCGRYQVESDWSDFPVVRIPEQFVASDDVRPTDLMPVVRIGAAGEWVAEMRRWGFLRMWPGASGKWIKRALFNAKGEELESKRAFREAYAKARCLVPMSAWYEWPVIAGKKTRVRIGLRHQRMFAAAGLFETSKDPKDGASVDTFTIVTVPPNQILGTTHDRAPLVLFGADYERWLEGGVVARQLIGAHADNDAFVVEPVAS
jgi:putative SOS response-associated peptidase YedK